MSALAAPAPNAGSATHDGAPSARRRRRERNLPLALGLSLVTLMVALAALGPRLAPRDPLERNAIMKDAEGTWHRHPFAPREMDGFPLGTDYDGRDVLSRLLHAVRPTLLVATLAATLRVGVGLALGMLGGWFGGRIRATVDGLITLATAMPLLIVALLFLYLAGRERTVLQFVVAISLTGWADSAALVASRTRALRGERFVEAARAMGAGPWHNLRHHVWPQLRALLPILVSFDVGGALLAMAELGFIGLYLGGGEYRAIAKGQDAGALLKLVPGQPELSQMLSAGWDNFFQTPWLSLWAGLAFFLAIFGFTLLGEGLKRVLATPFRRGTVSGT